MQRNRDAIIGAVETIQRAVGAGTEAQRAPGPYLRRADGSIVPLDAAALARVERALDQGRAPLSDAPAIDAPA